MIFDRSHYDRAARFLPWRLQGRVRNAEIHPHWIDESGCFTYARQTPAGVEFRLVDAERLETRTAFDHARLADLLSGLLDRPVAADALPVRHLTLDDRTGRRLRVHLADRILACDLDSGALEALPASVMAPGSVTSPDGTRRVARRDGDLV